jgi:amino acid adenylation domain-containing protein
MRQSLQSALSGEMSKMLPWATAEVRPLDRNGPVEVSFRPFEAAWVDRPAIQLFAEIAELHPVNIACEDIGTRLTFAEVWAASRRLAATIDAGVAPGKPVGVLLPNQVSYAVAVLACLGAARPCVLIDRNYSQDRVERIVRDAGLAAVVLRHVDLEEGYLLPAGVLALDLERALQEGTTPEGMPAPPPSPDAPSFIVYTSGSTGRPKGIVLSQRCVLHRAVELVNAVHLRPDDKVLSLASPGTIGGLQQIFEVMLSGATLVKLDLQRVGLRQVVRAVAERRITMMFSTPAVWRSVANLEGARDALASLRCIQSSGDTLLQVDYRPIRAVLPAGCHVLSVYGATEAPALLQWFVGALPHGEVRVPAGYPLEGFDFLVLDEQGRPVKDEAPGEFVIRSRFTSLGLWEDGEVRPGPFEEDAQTPEAKIYRTGDLVHRRPDGLYVVLGRRDRQIKIRGNRVELAEIETALRQAPGVLDAAIVARRTEREPMLFGFVVPQPGAKPGLVDKVRRHLEATLSSYMWPRRLFELAALPLLPGRKIDEEALLEHAARIGISAKGTRPDDVPIERQAAAMIAKAWLATFGRAPPKESVSFEEAGGDSLRLLQLVFELERLAGRALPIEHFQVQSTREQFALALEQCLAGALDAPPADAPALFLFPPEGRGDTYFTAFRAACALRLPVRRIAYPDLRAIVQPDATFATIAAHAVRQIDAARPAGPLFLSGYSDGGDVAYEAARQLRAMGRDVALLLILDTDVTGLAYPAPPADNQPSPAHRLARFARLPRLRQLRRLIQLSFAGRWPRTSFGRALIRRALTLPSPLPAGLTFVAYLECQFILFDEHHKQWLASLRLAALDVPVVLFRSDEPRPGAPEDLGWRPRATELTIVPVPGNHSTMLAASNGEEIAAEFTRRIRATQNTTKAGSGTVCPKLSLSSRALESGS